MTTELTKAAQQALTCLRYLKDQSDCDVDPFRWMQSKGNAAIDDLERALTQRPSAQEVDERAVFEAWIKKHCGDLSTFGTGPNRHYVNSAVNNAWNGWQARASLPTQPAAQATPAQSDCAGCEGKPSITNSPCAVCGGAQQATPEPSHAAKMLNADVAYVEQQMAAATPEPVGEPLQGGLDNDALLNVWRSKLPGVTPTDAQMTAFALGVEVGFAHARTLERSDWSRVHEALQAAGVHPGRTDDHLADVIAKALATRPAPGVPEGFALVPYPPEGHGYVLVRVDTGIKDGWCFCTPKNHPEDVARGLTDSEYDDSAQFFGNVLAAAQAKGGE